MLESIIFGVGMLLLFAFLTYQMWREYKLNESFNKSRQTTLKVASGATPEDCFNDAIDKGLIAVKQLEYPDSTLHQFSKKETDDAYIRMANNIRKEQGQVPIRVSQQYKNTDGLGNVLSIWNEYEEEPIATVSRLWDADRPWYESQEDYAYRVRSEAIIKRQKKYREEEWKRYALRYRPSGLLELQHCKPSQIPWNCDSIELTDDEYSKLYEILDYKSGAAREIFFDTIEQVRGYINHDSKTPVEGFKFLNNGWQVKADVYDRYRARGASAATVFQWMPLDAMIAPELDYSPHDTVKPPSNRADKSIVRKTYK